jgi:hypothetical protein
VKNKPRRDKTQPTEREARVAQIHDRLRSVASQAMQAQRMSPTSDNLCDILDDIDNDVQAVIELVRQVREAGGGE